MGDLLTIDTLKENLQPLLERCKLYKNKEVEVILIANPKAGGFTNAKRISEHKKAFSHHINLVKEKKSCVKKLNFTLIKTQYAGHASKESDAIISNIIKQKEAAKEHLFIIASGDGTFLEVQTAIAKKSFINKTNKKILMEKVAVLRLPFGTGNDGSDDRYLINSLKRLTAPAHFAHQKAVKVYYEGLSPQEISNQEGDNLRKKYDNYDSLDALAPWYAFNIASVGVDAYITYMTNKTKKIITGDFYQLWVDLACLFYELKFPPKKMNVELYDQKGTLIGSFNKKIMLALLGVSGYRQYGSNHKILPGEENFCSLDFMNLWKKICRKNSFNSGSHYKKNWATFYKAQKIRIHGDCNILVQMDGEVHFLQSKQFPLIMELTEPIIKIIECDDQKLYRGADIL